MALSPNRLDRDFQSYAGNVIDDGTDKRVVDTTALLQRFITIASTSGLSAGEAYDTIEFGFVNTTKFVLEYSLADVCQFQVEISFVDIKSFSLFKRACEFDLLLETGDRLLAENGDILRAQGLIP